MASPFTREQADQLLQSGQISPETHGMLVAGDPLAAGAAAAGLTPKAPIAPAPSPAADPIASAAQSLGLGGGTAPKVYNDFVPTGVAGTKLAQPVQVGPPSPPAAPQRPLDLSNVKVEGGVTLAPQAQRRLASVANDSGQPGSATSAPPSAPTRPTNNSAPSAAAEPTREQVANGQGIPRAPVQSGPSNDPRVNRAYAKYEREYGKVRAAEQEADAAGETLSRLQAEHHSRMSENANAFAAQAEEYQVQAARDESDYRAESQAVQQRIKLAADDAAKAKVDPDRFWKTRDTWQYIAGALGMALGAFGASITKTPNYAAELINKAIDRDIHAQETDLNNKWKKVDSERGVLGDLQRVYGDRRTARADAYKRAYDMTIAKGDALMAQSKSESASTEWEKTKAILSAERERHDFDVLQGLEQRQAQLDAAASAAQRAQIKEQREFFMARYGKTLDASLEELKKAADDGRPAADWAVQTARTAQQLGIPMPTGDNTHANAEGGAGLTKEQRFKMGEREHEAGEANAQFDRLLKHPAVTNSGDLGNAAVGMLPSAVTQRVAPGVAKQVQDVNEVNTQLIQQLGKVSKDADGKPNKETLKMFHDRFEIHSGDTPAIRAQKVEGVRNIVNSLLRAEGARSAPVPNDPSRGKAANDNDDPYAKYRVGGR